MLGSEIRRGGELGMPHGCLLLLGRDLVRDDLGIGSDPGLLFGFSSICDLIDDGLL